MRGSVNARVERGMTVKIYTKTGDEGMTGLLGSRPGAQGRRPDRGVRNGRRAQRRARAGAGPRAGRRGRRTGRAAPGASCSSSARPWPTLRPRGPFHNAITGEHVARLEAAIDALETELQPLTQFILPGGTPAGRADPPGADGLPPRRAADRQAVAPAGRGRSAVR